MKQTFYSNGKLLITGEYLVLDGAKAFALPTKLGQNLTVENAQNNQISWKSYDSDGALWFDETITFSNILNQTKFENQSVKNTLIEILHQAYKLNSDFIQKSDGYVVTTQLTFPKNWGLGTSSTLINNIATWLKVDAFGLLKESFGGSGYDIACAQNNTPITYQLINQKPIIRKVSFDNNFKENIYFVYLNKKQNSRNAIESYLQKKNNLNKIIPEINHITDKVLAAIDFENFAIQLQNHENLVSQVLEIPTVKEVLFPDFNGTIKSLGAWGGDFIMVLSTENPKEYFKLKGYEIVLSFHELIL
ncbi:GYDIA family GHMP kinase [Flavobacterium sp.]|uniref:GYDIA family GHMP kinase n=1 Tax=Flavobacterium sp. TaxID=239 RepID=UPI00286AB2C8|nr:GYDIA family GHMP kinase [Flavobacterium sp.]